MLEAQAGFFTAKQARDAGFSAKSHSYHVRNGSWERINRGIYRLADYPAVLRPELVIGHLWSMDRAGQAQGVYSHFTALGLYLEPNHPTQAKPGLEWATQLYMTVPTHFRRSAEAPESLKLHFEDLPESDIAARDGYRLTTPLRTILDLSRGNMYPRQELSKVLFQITERRLITRAQIKSARIPEAMKVQFEELLRSKKGKKRQGTVDRGQWTSNPFDSPSRAQDRSGQAPTQAQLKGFHPSAQNSRAGDPGLNGPPGGDDERGMRALFEEWRASLTTGGLSDFSGGLARLFGA